MTDLTIRGERILTRQGMRPASIVIRDGIIRAVLEIDEAPSDLCVVDAGTDVVMAGIVDTHVHVNEPGRTEWEGFATATRAAAAGGVTTIFDMPLNGIPATTTLASLEMKREIAGRNRVVNVGFIGGVVPGNADELPAMYDAGVRLFKCFLAPSGVDEFSAVTVHDLRIAMPVLAKLKGARLLVHAELPDYITPMPVGDPRQYATWLASRPDIAETSAVRLMIELAETYAGSLVHIVHLSSAESLPLIRDAQRRNVGITCETCPHYLTFAANEIGDGHTEFKCAPPIRAAATREKLWGGLMDGTIGAIVSDHSPCPPEMKALDSGSFLDAWGGIASLQLGLPAVWNEMLARNGHPEQLEERMCRAPSRLAGIHHCKGFLAAGYDADIVIWNPDAQVDPGAMTLYHRHPLTPYRGRTLTGAVRATYVGGVEVFRDGRIGATDAGRLISPGTYLPRLHD